MTEAIRLSIALVTRNRPEDLGRCLESLRAQSVQPWEVIVSDDSDGESAIPTRLVAESHGCRYLHGPRRGLYANRNAAASACEGTHVRTADDDHLFPEGHLACCLEAVQRDRMAIWTTGEIGYVDGKFFGRSERATQLLPAGVGGEIRDPDDNWGVADGSTIYPASVFRKGYRMVDSFGYGASYLEFGAFLYRKGYRGRCIPGALIEHRSGSATLSRGSDRCEVESRLFASICFNRHFQPNPIRLVRYLISNLASSRSWPTLIPALPRLWRLSALRWGGGR